MPPRAREQACSWPRLWRTRPPAATATATPPPPLRAAGQPPFPRVPCQLRLQLRRRPPPVPLQLDGAWVSCAARSTLLLDSLHSGGLAGTQRACGQGGCGACTMHIVDDRGKATPVNACLIEADGHARRETGTISKRRRHQRSATAEAGTGGVPLRSCTAVCMQCVTSSRLFWYEWCAGLLLLVQLAPRNALATTLSNKLFCGARRVD